MGWLNINGNWIGSHSGKSWQTYWTTLISATVENAAPTHVVLTFPKTNTSVTVADFSIAGFTILSGSWMGAVFTIVVHRAVEYGNELVVTFGRSGGTTAVTNNVAGEAEAVALIARMTTEPTGVRKTIINNTVKRLKTAGLWVKLKALWLLSAHEEISAFLNWISTSFNLTVGAAGGNFTADYGWQGDATGAYLKTGFKPATHGGAGFQNSASIGMCSRTSESGKYPIGSYSATSYFFIGSFTGGQGIIAGMNTTTLSTNVAIANSVGYSIAVRDDGDVRNYRNKIADTDTIASVAPNDYEVLIGARNGVGTPNGFSGALIQFAFIGDKLTTAEVGLLEDIIDDYFWAVGTSAMIDSDVVKTVKADGTGDYLTIPAAIAGIADAATGKRYRIDVYDDWVIDEEADYGQTSGTTKVCIKNKQYISVNGVGRRKMIYFSIPDSAVATDYYGVELNTISRFQNLDLDATNIAYPIHMDGFVDNSTTKYKYGIITNNGREGLRTYRTANGGTVPKSFGDVIGIGMGDNTNITWKDVKFVSKGNTLHGGYYVHDKGDTIVAKSYMLFDGCEFDTEDDYDIYINPIVSSIASEIEFKNTVLSKDLAYHTTISVARPTADGINHWDLRTILLTDGGGNTFNGWDNLSTGGGSLRITSATAGAVAITGGTAEADIMPNSEAATNQSTGKLECGAWANSSQIVLGYRLGDCSSVIKTLTGTIDGGAFTVTFDEDFTSQTNAQVLAFITAALAGAGTASLYQWAQEYNPLSL